MAGARSLDGDAARSRGDALVLSAERSTRRAAGNVVAEPVVVGGRSGQSIDTHRHGIGPDHQIDTGMRRLRSVVSRDAVLEPVFRVIRLRALHGAREQRGVVRDDMGIARLAEHTA